MTLPGLPLGAGLPRCPVLTPPTETTEQEDEMNAATRQILELAQTADLNPHYDEDGAQGQNGVARLIVNGKGHNGLFGAIYVSVRTGKVTHANLTHGNWGDEKRYTGPQAVRNVLTSWIAVTA